MMAENPNNWNAYRIEEVMPAHVSMVFNSARRWIDAGIDKSNSLHTADDLLGDIMRGHRSLWAIWEMQSTKAMAMKAVFIVHYSTWPKGRALEVTGLGGEDMAAWFPQLNDTLTLLARNTGCSFIVGVGRHGWKKFLPKFGWVEGPVVMMRQV